MTDKQVEKEAVERIEKLLRTLEFKTAQKRTNEILEGGVKAEDFLMDLLCVGTILKIAGEKEDSDLITKTAAMVSCYITAVKHCIDKVQN